MTSDSALPRDAFVWTWLPGTSEPVVAGRLVRIGDEAHFVYGRSYRERADAVPLYLPELPREQRRPVTAGVCRGQPHRGQDAPVTIHHLRAEQASGTSQFGGEDHSDGDRLAVPPPVTLDLFDRMAEGVPIVEDLPEPGLGEVRRDHLGLDRDGPFDEFLGSRS